MQECAFVHGLKDVNFPSLRSKPVFELYPFSSVPNKCELLMHEASSAPRAVAATLRFTQMQGGERLSSCVSPERL
jgi:hypothetical protein